MFSSSTFADGRHIIPGFVVFGTAGATDPRWQVITGAPPTTVTSAASFNSVNWYQGCTARGRIFISPFSTLRYLLLLFTTQSFSFRDIVFTDGTNADANFAGGKIQYGGSTFMTIYSVLNSTTATDIVISTDGGNSWTRKVGVLPANYAWGIYGGLAYNPNNSAWGAIPYSTVSPQSATNICRYSTDNGTTWNAGGNFPANRFWLDLCYANNKWLALASDATYYSTSDTMASWTQVTIPSGGPTSAYKCKYKNGIFMVVGGIWNGSIYTAAAMTSTDGINFTAASTGLPSNFLLRDVDYGNGYWVAVGTATSGSASANTTAYYYSNNNGASWTAGTLNLSAQYAGVIYGDSKWD